MIADIFYPIFTLTITVLACFIQKNCLGLLPSPRHCPGPLEVLQLPQTPSCNRFWLGQKLMRPYFFCIIPWLRSFFLTTFNFSCDVTSVLSFLNFCGVYIGSSCRHSPYKSNNRSHLVNLYTKSFLF